MKSISAAIVILSGAFLVAWGGVAGHGDTATFVMAVGCVLGIVGLVVWFTLLLRKDE